MNQKYKKDAGKLRMDLIPPSTIKALAMVLTYGANKYSESTWRNVEPYRYKAALLRHIVAWMDGEQLDEESQLPHLYHALTNLAFLIDMTESTSANVDDEALVNNDELDDI